ncbi:hypothetical protein LCGC14_0942860 [marine sediment metagenome]|uniref:PEP-CTERM protein-sorting domain-containing protein n=1 Tax=marine sediment metagenome TaxID=412755 RepID=A0A0F9P5N1_9ZZZZ|nr:hypothetical protein [Methylophaga sp.]HEC59006.1 hypothetical protein [Methylophaga sp.]
MKKVMLLVAALLFSVGANAATLSLKGFQSTNATQNVDVASGSVVLGSGLATLANGGSWKSQFDLSSDTTTPVKVSWTFNPEASLASGWVKFKSAPDDFKTFFISNVASFSFITTLYANQLSVLDFVDATGSVLKYTVSVSAVPVPAALFLFAPVLLGFLGLRKKHALTA